MEAVAMIGNRRRGRLAVAAVVAMLVAASPLVPRPAAASPESPGPASVGTSGALASAGPRAVPDGALFVPVAPCRLVDTRVASGAMGVNVTRPFQVSGAGAGFAAQGGRSGGCGVPVSAVAAETSVTAVDPQGNGFFRMWPSGGPATTATFLNFTGGQGITNTGTVGLGAGPKELTVENFGAVAHYVIDVQGYFVMPGDVPLGVEGSVFVPVAPCRAVDTRVAGGIVEANVQRQFQVAGDGTAFAAQGGTAGGCGVPESAVAAEVSVTAVGPLGSGFLRMWPSGGVAATATFLNFTGGQGITNTGTVGLGSGVQDLTVENFAASAHYVIDVQGYFADQADLPVGLEGALFVPVAPCRTVDTRVVGGVVGASVQRQFQVAGDGGGFVSQGGRSGGCGVPDGALAAEVSVTAVGPQGSGFLRMWPSGGVAATATFLNFTGGQGITNTGTIGLGSGTKDLTVKNFGAAAHYVIDVQGYFVAPARVPVIDVVVRRDRSCALRSDGTVWCWGVIEFGTPDGNETSFSNVAIPIEGIDDAIAIDLGGVHGCAVLAGGGVKCWGDNTYEDLGDGTTISSFTAGVAVVGITNATAVDIGQSSCALLVDGAVRCWGNNYYGQLGNGTTVNSPVPVAVTGITDAVTIEVSWSHACAVVGGGQVRCWGSNGYGRLGDGTTVDSPVPVAVVGITGVVDLELASNRTCVVLPGGAVRCWGNNSYGQLGNGTVVDSPVPVAPTGITDVVDLAVEDNTTCAVLADGTARCWGYNGGGQLGNGTMVGSSVPVAVSGITDAVAIDTSNWHSCAVLAGGTVSCWGTNARGELGNGTRTRSSVPVVAAGLTEAIAISVVADNSCAMRADGSVQCWGDNYYGELGNGSSVNPLVPGPVIGL